MLNRREFYAQLQTHGKTTLSHLASLTLLQKLWLLSVLLFIAAFSVLFAVYHSALFRVVEGWKGDLLASSWKWIFLVLVTASTSVPPLIGYSTSVTLAGYVFGFLRGWGIAVLGSLIGSSLAFGIYRHLLLSSSNNNSNNLADRIKDSAHPKFIALTRALDGNSGLTLLTMMRFCPFPFALSNAALATVPSITFPRFLFATTVGCARLSVHAFVGSKLASLAEDPNQDRTAKIVNWLGIVVGLALGIGSGIVVYRRTKQIADRLEAARAHEQQQEGREELLGSRSSHHDVDDDYFDDVRSTEDESLLR